MTHPESIPTRTRNATRRTALLAASRRSGSGRSVSRSTVRNNLSVEAAPEYHKTVGGLDRPV